MMMMVMMMMIDSESDSMMMMMMTTMMCWPESDDEDKTGWCRSFGAHADSDSHTAVTVSFRSIQKRKNDTKTAAERSASLRGTSTWH